MSHEAAQPDDAAELSGAVQPRDPTSNPPSVDESDVSEPEVQSVTPTEADASVETQHAPTEVGLQRSVRFGRIIIAVAALGAVAGLVASLFFPVQEGANYELGQVAGLMAVVGAAIGLTLGALLALLLGIVAKRKRGAAIAVQTDVR